MNLIHRIGIASALALSSMVGSAANAAGAASGYSWTEILIPTMGPVGSACGIDDNDQGTRNNRGRLLTVA